MERLQEKPILEQIDYNREQRLYDDTTTWLAEVLDGQMRTEFEYSFDGHELYGRDGSPLKPIFKTAIKDAERLAVDNPKLAFEVRRRLVEEDELEDMYGMARNELANTMVVISDPPAELNDATEDIGGYNIRRKQTMLRVITRGEDGKIRMRSQSLDRSDRTSLEAIYTYLGFEAQPGELLGQRMHVELPTEEQEFLADWLTGVYDRTLSSQYGGEWYAGRTPAEMINTYEFVCAQRDLVETFVRQKMLASTEAESLRYGVAAAMEKRFKTRFQVEPAISTIPAIEHTLQEIEMSGALAAIEGRTFSGCGMSLFANDESSSQNEMGELGFGNQSQEDKYGPLKFKCPNGHWNKRPPAKSPKDFLTHCTTCKVSVSC